MLSPASCVVTSLLVAIDTWLKVTTLAGIRKLRTKQWSLVTMYTKSFGLLSMFFYD
jgi:hypothetical protein